MHSLIPFFHFAKVPEMTRIERQPLLLATDDESNILRFVMYPRRPQTEEINDETNTISYLMQ